MIVERLTHEWRQDHYTKKFGVTLKFHFGPDQMTFCHTDNSGERQFSVPYETINVPSASILTVNNIQFARNLMFVPWAMFIAAFALQGPGRAVAHAVGLVGLVLLVALWIGRILKIFAVKYTIFTMQPSPPGPANAMIRIIHDRKHAGLNAEIKTRWKARLKKLYGKINFSGDPQKEIAKFSYLKKHDVIDDDEYRYALEALQAFAAQEKTKSPESGLN